MADKEVLRKINKIKSKEVKKMFKELFKKSNEEEKKKYSDMLESFENLLNNLDFKAKAIAAYVRMNIEDVHCEHLSDKQMKELNPLIRNAIYTFLVDESNGHTFKMMFTCNANLAPYWEDCEYLDEVNK